MNSPSSNWVRLLQMADQAVPRWSWSKLVNAIHWASPEKLRSKRSNGRHIISCVFTVFTTVFIQYPIMFSSWSSEAHVLLCYISQWPSEAHCYLQYRTCLHSDGNIRWMSHNHGWTRQLSCPLTVTSLLEYCAVTVCYYWVRKLTSNLDMNWRWIPFWLRERIQQDVLRVIVICSVQWLRAPLDP